VQKEMGHRLRPTYKAKPKENKNVDTQVGTMWCFETHNTFEKSGIEKEMYRY